MSGTDARAATSSREIGVKAEQVDTSMGFVTMRPLRFRGNDERELTQGTPRRFCKATLTGEAAACDAYPHEIESVGSRRHVLIYIL